MHTNYLQQMREKERETVEKWNRDNSTINSSKEVNEKSISNQSEPVLIRNAANAQRNEHCTGSKFGVLHCFLAILFLDWRCFSMPSSNFSLIFHCCFSLFLSVSCFSILLRCFTCAGVSFHIFFPSLFWFLADKFIIICQSWAAAQKDNPPTLIPKAKS